MGIRNNIGTASQNQEESVQKDMLFLMGVRNNTVLLLRGSEITSARAAKINTNRPKGHVISEGIRNNIGMAPEH